jgi:hypothetical protein
VKLYFSLESSVTFIWPGRRQNKIEYTIIMGQVGASCRYMEGSKILAFKNLQPSRMASAFRQAYGYLKR